MKPFIKFGNLIRVHILEMKLCVRVCVCACARVNFRLAPTRELCSVFGKKAECLKGLYLIDSKS